MKFDLAEISFKQLGCRAVRIANFYSTPENIDELKNQLNDGNYRHLKCLYFIDSQFTRFPIKLSEFFPNLEIIYAVKCGIKMISYGDIFGLEKLQCLYLDENNIIDFPYRYTVFFSKLRVLTLGNCRFSKGASECFKSIRSMTTEDDLLTKKKLEGSKLDALEMLTNQGKDENKSKENVNELGIEANQLASIKNTLFNCEALKDFTIAGDEKVVKAHRLILASHSIKMLKLFEEDPDMKELVLVDSPFEGAKACLDFVYDENLILEDDQLSVKSLAGMLAAAEELGVEKFKKFVERKMIELIEDSNVAEIIDIANKYDSQNLVDAIFDYIQEVIPDKKLCEKMKENPIAMAGVIQMQKNLRELQALKQKIEAKISKMTARFDAVVENRDADNGSELSDSYEVISYAPDSSDNGDYESIHEVDQEIEEEYEEYDTE